MTRLKKLLLGLAAVVALALGGAAIAGATGDDESEGTIHPSADLRSRL